MWDVGSSRPEASVGRAAKLRGGGIWEVQMRWRMKAGNELASGGEEEALAVQDRLRDKDVEVIV